MTENNIERVRNLTPFFETVYVICSYMTTGSNALRAFDSKDKAEEWLKKNYKNHRYGDSFDILEMKLNDVTPLKHWRA